MRARRARGEGRVPWLAGEGRVPWLAGVVLAAWTASAAAQAPGQASLGDLALTWAMGVYKGPVICQIESRPARIARTVTIQPPRRRGHRTLFRLEVASLDVGERRCVNELGQDEPDVSGILKLAMEGHHRPDTASRDFQHTLRKKGGFEFEVPSGQLTIRPSGGEARQVSFAGGRARMLQVGPGSDAARMLGDVGRLPRRSLLLTAPDGTELVFHLVQVKPR